jgi:hypothetical protein
VCGWVSGCTQERSATGANEKKVQNTFFLFITPS